jgi:BirA family biotin operon repressor/biotin-[acetyl-CoA-carboxylase] ligase
MTGVAILEVLRPLGEEAMFVKWPNDIMSRNRKLAGILTETIIYGEHLTCISGIGINVNQDVSEFPPHLRQTAISLKDIYNRSFSIEKIKQTLAHAFNRWIEKLEHGEVEEITATINRASYHSAGDKIRFHQGERIIEGTFIRIDRDGGLILQEEGKRSSYYSGEIQNI